MQALSLYIGPRADKFLLRRNVHAESMYPPEKLSPPSSLHVQGYVQALSLYIGPWADRFLLRRKVHAESMYPLGERFALITRAGCCNQPAIFFRRFSQFGLDGIVKDVIVLLSPFGLVPDYPVERFRLPHFTGVAAKFVYAPCRGTFDTLCNCGK